MGNIGNGCVLQACLLTLLVYRGDTILGDQDDVMDAPRRPNQGWVKKSYNYTSWFWVILALTSLAFQASRTSTSSTTYIELLSESLTHFISDICSLV